MEIFCARQHLDYRDKAQITELGHWFRDSDLKLHSLHAPMYTDEIWGRSGPHAVITITEPVKSQRLQQVDEIKRALEIAETIPFRYLIQHMGVGGEEFDERKVDAAFSALEELNLFARQRGVEILLENIPNELSSAERLLQFEELTHLKLNYAFDTGHAHMNEGIADRIQPDEGAHPLDPHPRQRRPERFPSVPLHERWRDHRLEGDDGTAASAVETSIRCCWS